MMSPAELSGTRFLVCNSCNLATSVLELGEDVRTMAFDDYRMVLDHDGYTTHAWVVHNLATAAAALWKQKFSTDFPT